MREKSACALEFPGRSARGFLPQKPKSNDSRYSLSMTSELVAVSIE